MKDIRVGLEIDATRLQQIGVLFDVGSRITVIPAFSFEMGERYTDGSIRFWKYVRLAVALDLLVSSVRFGEKVNPYLGAVGMFTLDYAWPKYESEEHSIIGN